MFHLPLPHSLKIRLITLFLLLGSFFAIFTAKIISSYVSRFSQAQQHHTLALQANSHTQKINFLFLRNQSLAKNLSNNPIIQSFLTGTFPEASVLSQFQAVFDPSSSSAISLLGPNSLVEVLGSSLLNDQGRPPTPSYQKFQVGQPAIQLSDDGSVYYFSHPVTSPEALVIGVIVVTQDAGVLAQELPDLKPGESISLTDEFGIIAYSTEPSRLHHSLGRLTSQAKTQIKSNNLYPNINISPLGYDSIQQQLKSISTPQTFSIADPSTQLPNLLSVAKLPDFPYYYLMELPGHDGLSPAVSLSLYLGAILVISFLAFTLLIIFITSKFLQPLGQLKQAAFRVTQGDFAQVVPVQSSDEFGKLAESFNTILSVIRQSHSATESQVTRQTQQLLEEHTHTDSQQRAILNILEDIEDEKNKTQELANRLQEKSQILTEEKFKTDSLLESIGDGIIATNEHGEISVVNLSAQQLLGYPQSELQGRPVYPTLRLLDKNLKEVPKNRRPIIIALSSGKKMSTPTSEAFYYQKKDGSLFPVGVTVTPFMLKNRTVGAIEVFRDITIEKEIDKAKTEFVSLASHQLRTPLTTVSWYTEMLLSGDAGKLSPRQIEFLKVIYQGNRRMNDLVSDLLNISRIELGTFVVDPKPISIPELVNEVLADLRPLIIERKIRVLTSFGRKPPVITADPGLLRMIVQNLISNAVKYSKNRHQIKLSAEVGKTNFLITVSDQGVGIPVSQQSLIFSKMFRANNARQKNIEGNGLGLYIVKSIVDYSGGKIWFESIENKGTTFYVTLPRRGMPGKIGTKALTGSLVL
ncbi:MAG: ATP-binding protein [Candidatus Shapirobacteria bacterium]|jgi:PAS domain S-box-containing protein